MSKSKNSYELKKKAIAENYIMNFSKMIEIDNRVRAKMNTMENVNKGILPELLNAVKMIILNGKGGLYKKPWYVSDFSIFDSNVRVEIRIINIPGANNDCLVSPISYSKLTLIFFTEDTDTSMRVNIGLEDIFVTGTSIEREELKTMFTNSEKLATSCNAAPVWEDVPF